LKTALIAGYGVIPLIAAENLIKMGDNLLVIPLYEEVTADFSSLENAEIKQFSVTQVGKIIKTMRSAGVQRVLFAGKVNKSLLFSDIKFDITAVKLLASTINRKDDTLMQAVCEEMEANGIEVMKQSDVLKEMFLESGVYSKKKPSKDHLADIDFGMEIAKELGRLDIGQTVVVKDKAVMALEAIEGTDEAVKRGCQLAKKDAVVVKCSKPSQDERFDIPTVGVDTLMNLSDNNGRVLAVEAGKTFVVDKQACIKFADEHKIIFLAK